MRKRFFAVLAAVLVGGVGMAQAADDAKPNRPAKGEGPSREAVLKKFDKNGDGTLDDSEKAAAKAEFAKNRPDAAGAGKPGERKPGQGGPAGRLDPEKMKELIKKFDKNGDGTLDGAEKEAAREEFMKLRGGAGKPGDGKPGAGGPGGRPDPEKMKELIAKFDKNGDGKLDESEREAARANRPAGGRPGPKPPEKN